METQKSGNRLQIMARDLQILNPYFFLTGKIRTLQWYGG